MKFIEYCDTADDWKLTATAVSVYSFRKLSGLPKGTEYILYCREAEKAKGNKVIQSVFSRVELPPLDCYSIKSHALTNQWERATWEKFACWCYTSCDGEPVFHADYDTLCFGDITDSIPPSDFHFSGRLNKECNVSCNGGYYCKSPRFDSDKIFDIMLEPIFNQQAYDEAHDTWIYTDEMGIVNYFTRFGRDKFFELEWKFNMPVLRQKKTHRSIWQNDIRILHYIGTVKPWQDKSQQRYKAQRQHWLRVKDELESEYNV